MKRAAFALAMLAPLAAMAHDLHGLTHDHASPAFFLACWILASTLIWIFDSLTATKEK